MTRRVITTSPVETLVRHVKALIEKGDKAAEKAEQFYKSAGIHIKEIKQQSEDWETIVREQCNIGRSRAYELMAIADGRTTLEKVRASTNERQKVHRAKPEQESVTSRTEPEPVAPRVTGSQEAGVEQRRAEYAALDAEPEEVITVKDDLEANEYRKAFLLRAADAMAFAVYSGDVDVEVIAAAERVAVKWQDFAQSLKARRGAPDLSIPADLSIPDFMRRTEAVA